jgi:hypothetical protein
MDRAMDRVNLTKQIEAMEAIPDEQIDAEIAKMSLQPGKNSVGSLPV